MDRPRLLAELLDLTRSIALGDTNRATVAAELRRIAAAVAPELRLTTPDEVPSKAPASQQHLEDWKRVFHYWQSAMDKPKARPTGDRRSKVLARLREGYTLTQILRAIDGCAASPYHMGQNDDAKTYNDLTLICRSGAKIEDFIERADGAGASSHEPAAEDPRMAALEDAAMAALQAGDTEAYNARMRELDAVRRAS